MRPETLTSEALRKLLNSGDEADRCYAARTLGILNDQDAIDQLIERLQDEDLDVCIDSAEALGRIGSKRAIPALLESLSNDSSGEVCAVVVESLGQIGSLDALEALTKIAIERPEQMEWNDDWDTWWDVQLEAVKAMGILGNEAAVDTLLQILDDEGQQDIENTILASLANIPGKGVNTLIERLNADETRIIAKCRLCKALSLTNNTEGIRALGRALQNDEAEVRAAAALGLAATDAQRYAKPLLMLLRDSSEDVRNAALKAIISLSKNSSLTAETMEELLPALEDNSSQVRGTLISMLVNSLQPGDLSESQIKSVEKSLSDSAAETAAAACTLLGRNQDPQALPALLELLQFRGGHPMVRRQAALAVGDIGQLNEETLANLTACVGDQQQPVRLGALSALMQLESSFEVSESEEETSLQRPLQIIIDAVKGDIKMAPNREQIMEKLQQEATPEQEDDAESIVDDPRGLSTSDGDNVKPEYKEGEALPAEFADYIKPPAAIAEPDIDAKTKPEALVLPDTPAKIVDVGEVNAAVSTLDAIAMDNVEVNLNLHQVEEDVPDLDEVAEEYMAVVETNKETMRRIRSEKHIQPEQDVRRLGARILSECQEPAAIVALTEALSDEDSLLRREAADAVGIIGSRDAKTPELMDAVGILITQLAMGDMLQKVTCARALGHLGNKLALQPLIYALDDKEPNVRVQAIDALARLVIQGADPKEADHMVIIELSPLSVSKRLMTCLEDEALGVRVAAARGLSTIVPTLNETRFAERVVDSIIASVALWTGEEARPLGRCLRDFDKTQCTEKLLHALSKAGDSLKRSVYIEMLEELLNPELGQSELAA